MLRIGQHVRRRGGLGQAMPLLPAGAAPGNFGPPAPFPSPPPSGGSGSVPLSQQLLTQSFLFPFIVGMATWAFFGDTIKGLLGITGRLTARGVEAVGNRVAPRRDSGGAGGKGRGGGGGGGKAPARPGPPAPPRPKLPPPGGAARAEPDED